MECFSKHHGRHVRYQATVADSHIDIVQKIYTQSMLRHEGKYILGPYEPGDEEPQKEESTGKPVNLPPGMILHAHEFKPESTNEIANPNVLCLMPHADLAKYLRATFKTFNIPARVLELDKGVWVDDKTLDGLATWSEQEPLNKDALPKKELTLRNQHDSSGPWKFVRVFDRIAQSQAEMPKHSHSR